MLRAATASAARIWPASGPLAPVTCTSWTATSDESRNHRRRPPSRSPTADQRAAISRGPGRQRRRRQPASRSTGTTPADARPEMRARALSDRLQSLGSATGPSACTSGSSSTPNRSLTRRRPSAITATTSAVRRLAVVLDEVRVLLGEARAADAQPRQPAASSSWPALRPSARGSLGFLKVEPNVLIPDGWASVRRRRMSASVSLTSSGGAGSSANEARATTSPGASDERR